VLLGSVHWIDEWLFDAYDTPAFARRWQGAEVDAVFDRYVDEVLALASSGLVDVLAHLDVIRVAGHRASELAEHDHRLATGLAGSGLVIEVSSGGLRKPVADIYPAPDLLRKLVDAGMTFTTASDGHDLDQVGRGLDRVREELRGVGVDVLTTFDRRRPQSVPI
ncbi:MAG: histidinol phosphate phosphatase, partial [Actinomycetota bacterium]